jgi:hypothetical protein
MKTSAAPMTIGLALMTAGFALVMGIPVFGPSILAAFS